MDDAFNIQPEHCGSNYNVRRLGIEGGTGDDDIGLNNETLINLFLLFGLLLVDVCYILIHQRK